MNRIISDERLKKLNFDGFDKGDQILFCHECDWQAKKVMAMKPECPKCGAHLYLVGIDLAKNHSNENK
jgi:ssDNA-binding Zn-finger/Zn-ribbon topoisomerase 1